MEKTIKILIVEDSIDDVELVVRALRREGFCFQWVRVDSEDEFLINLDSTLNLIICDYSLPQFSGLRALELLATRSDLDVPLIMVTGTIEDDEAVMMMRRGVSDYILKDRMARLGTSVRRVLLEVEIRKEKKQLENQFIESQKMQVMGHLTGSVAHDFNNALAVIMGYSDLVSNDLGPQHVVQPYLQELRDASRRASGLTQQLLLFGRKEPVQTQLLQLNGVITDLRRSLLHLIYENIKIDFDLKEVGEVNADPGYIWQLLMNLVINARDAMAQGGTISIRTERLTVRKDDLTFNQEPNPGIYTCLIVSDTGVGMTAETLTNMFQPFYTTKQNGRGTGLGMFTCQTIVRQCGGHIAVQSRIGRGTTFTIYFPEVASPSQRSGLLPFKTSSLRLGAETILVVEDNSALCDMVANGLKRYGYTVLVAHCGVDALQVAKDHLPSKIDLVITDLVMPEMGGLQMTEQMRNIYPNTQILFTSGYTQERLVGKGTVLQKPYDIFALTKCVRSILSASSATIYPERAATFGTAT